MAIMKAETRNARQLFLYGDGSGKPIRGVKALVAATGLHENTICKWIPIWSAEAEEIVANTSEKGLALHLSKETLDQHKKDMIFLRDDVNSIKFEMDNLDNCIEKLEKICENFSLNSDNGDEAIKLFDRYLRASLNKSSLRSQFLAAEKRWVELSGILDLKDIQVTQEKALAQGRAKQKLKAEADQDVPRNVVSTMNTVFARNLPDPETVPED